MRKLRLISTPHVATVSIFVASCIEGKPAMPAMCPKTTSLVQESSVIETEVRLSAPQGSLLSRAARLFFAGTVACM
jgi:hypothetical protein